MRIVTLCEYASKLNKWKLVEPKNRIEKQNCCAFGTVPRMMPKYTLNRESHVLCISLFAIPWHSRTYKKNYPMLLILENILQHHDRIKMRNSLNSEKRHMKIYKNRNDHQNVDYVGFKHVGHSTPNDSVFFVYSVIYSQHV